MAWLLLGSSRLYLWIFPWQRELFWGGLLELVLIGGTGIPGAIFLTITIVVVTFLSWIMFRKADQWSKNSSTNT